MGQGGLPAPVVIRQTVTAHEAVLAFEHDDERCASIVEQSIREEVGEIAGERTDTRVERDGRVLSVRIETTDRVALRAGINTWCSFVEVAAAVAALGAAGQS